MILTSGIVHAGVPLEPVATGRGHQWLPWANDDYVVYGSWKRSGPNRTDALAKDSGGTTTRLNPGNKNGLPGGIDPGTNTVLYQQWTNRRSDLFLYDLDTSTRVQAPGVNTRFWEWHPRISSSFITFFRDRYRRGTWYTNLHVYERDSGTMRRIGTWRTRPVDTFNGSAGDRYVAYTICTQRCRALLYDWDTGTTTRIPSNTRHQYAPVIDEVNGTVYFSAGGNCGVNINIWRLPLTLEGARTKIVDLPNGIDTGWTSSLAVNGASGMMDLYIERWDCRRRNADVYVARSVDVGPA